MEYLHQFKMMIIMIKMNKKNLFMYNKKENEIIDNINNNEHDNDNNNNINRPKLIVTLT